MSNEESSIVTSLRSCASEAQRNTHCPYSMYPVGCAILSEEGNIHIGSNVENAAYPQSMCAESNAIGSMIVAGDKKISRVFLISPNGGPPCGGCLQKIAEFAPDSGLVEIYSVTTKKPGSKIQIWMLSNLLPHQFDKNKLFEHVSESQKKSPVHIPTVWIRQGNYT